MISGVCKSSEWKIRKCCKKIKNQIRTWKIAKQGAQIGKKKTFFLFFSKCKCESMQIEETIEYLLLDEWIVPFDGREGSIEQMWVMHWTIDLSICG